MLRSRTAAVILLGIAGSLVLTLSHPGLPGAVGMTPQEKGRLAGRVVDDTTGAAVAHAHVKLRGRDSDVELETTADQRGRFSIGDVAPGEYYISAVQSGYVSRGTLRSGASTRVLANQTPDVRIPLAPSGVMLGRVVDAAGNPMPWTHVQLLRNAHSDGLWSVECNRAGEFRLEGVRAGRYTLRGVAVQADATGPTRLIPTFYPNASAIDQASFIDVGPGATISGLDITLLEERTALVSGRVIDTLGRPIERATVQPFVRHARGLEPVALMAGADAGDLQSDGRFRLRLPVGEYVLIAQAEGVGSVSAGELDIAGITDARQAADALKAVRGALAAMLHDQSRRRERGVAHVALGPLGATGIVMTLERSMSGRGRFVFEGRAPWPALAGATFMLTTLGSTATSEIVPAALNADWTFEFRAFAGALVADDAFAAAPWTVQEIRHNGVNITQHPATVGTGDALNDVVVVMTDRQTSIDFRVTDERASATTDYVALIFPVDDGVWASNMGRARWHVPSHPANASDVMDVTPGEYYVIAVDDLEFDDVRDPDVLKNAVEGGRDGDTRSRRLEDDRSPTGTSPPSAGAVDARLVTSTPGTAGTRTSTRGWPPGAESVRWMAPAVPGRRIVRGGSQLQPSRGGRS